MRSRVAWWTGLLLCLACWGACAASAGAVGFGTPVLVAPSGVPALASAPSVAVDASNRTVVAWQSDDGVLARIGPAPGRLRPAQRLGEGYDAHVSISPDGTAAIIWLATPSRARGRRLLFAAIAPPGRRFGRPQLLLSVVANVPTETIVATDGRVVAVWGADVPGREPATSSEIRYAIAGSSDRFGAVHTLARAYYATLDGAEADAAGDVAVAYQTPLRAATNTQVAAAVMAAGASSFSAPQLLSGETMTSLPYSQADEGGVFAGPGGIAVGFNIEATLPWLLRASLLSPSLSFGPALQATAIPNPPPSLTWFTGPVLAVPGRGGVLAAWTVGRDYSATGGPQTGAMEAASLGAGGFGAPVQLAPPATLSQYAEAAATEDLAIVVWGEGFFDRERMEYAMRSEQGAFTTPRQLGADALRQAAVAGAGKRCVVAWISGHRLFLADLTG